jgi:hypothetical protein
MPVQKIAEQVDPPPDVGTLRNMMAFALVKNYLVVLRLAVILSPTVIILRLTGPNRLYSGAMLKRSHQRLHDPNELGDSIR